MNIYTVQDSQGRTIQVGRVLSVACSSLVEHAESIIDYPEIRRINCPNDNYTIYAIFEDNKRAFSPESDGFTIQQWDVD